MPELQAMLDALDWRTLGEVGLKLLLVVVATVVALRFASVTIHTGLTRLFQREVEEGTSRDVSADELARRRETLDGLLNRSLRLIILIIAFLMALAILRLDIGPAIAGLGLLGLALSLGAQNLVRDYVAGAFVLIENQYARGDVVTIAGVTGAVEDVSLRRTVLRDLDGTVHSVPHGLIETSSNLTRSWSRVNLDVPVPYGTPLDRITRVIDEAGQTLANEPAWKARVVEAPRVLRVEVLGEMGMVLKVLGVVTAAEQWSAAGELRRLIIEGCEREGLSLGWRTVTAVAIAGGEETAEQAERSRRKS